MKSSMTQGVGRASIIRQLGPILVHIYPIIIIYMFIEVILIITLFFGAMVGPYIKSRVTGGNKISANTHLVILETCYNKGKQLTTSLSNLGNNVYK